jgi:hypothetical protein
MSPAEDVQNTNGILALPWRGSKNVWVGYAIARIAPISKSTDQDTVPPVSQLAHDNYNSTRPTLTYYFP